MYETVILHLVDRIIMKQFTTLIEYGVTYTGTSHLETGRSVASNESAPRKTSIPTEYVGLKTIVKYNRQNLTKWVLVFSIKGKAIIDSSHISYLENQRT